MASAGGGNKEGSAKAIVSDQICQAVQSTSNLLRFMQETSPSQARLLKLPKNLLEKASTIKHTGQVLEQLPGVVSSLDARMDNGLHRVSHLQTVIQMLSNMESCQLNFTFQGPYPREEDQNAEEQ